MEYTVKDIKEIAKVSSRTLHYYDEIGLLNPSFTTEAGYRIYKDFNKYYFLGNLTFL